MDKREVVKHQFRTRPMVLYKIPDLIHLLNKIMGHMRQRFNGGVVDRRQKAGTDKSVGNEQR